jgi:hypothetical protein
MRRLKLPLLMLLCFPLATLGGCKFTRSKCNATQAYDGATSVPPIHAPEGLAAPSNKNSLVVPDFDRPLVRHGSKDKCIDEPPPYFVEQPQGGAPALTPPVPAVTPAPTTAAPAPATAAPAPTTAAPAPATAAPAPTTTAPAAPAPEPTPQR